MSHLSIQLVSKFSSHFTDSIGEKNIKIEKHIKKLWLFKNLY